MAIRVTITALCDVCHEPSEFSFHQGSLRFDVAAIVGGLGWGVMFENRLLCPWCVEREANCRAQLDAQCAQTDHREHQAAAVQVAAPPPPMPEPAKAGTTNGVKRGTLTQAILSLGPNESVLLHGYHPDTFHSTAARAGVRIKYRRRGDAYEITRLASVPMPGQADNAHPNRENGLPTSPSMC